MHTTVATVGSRPGTAGEFCAQKKAFFYPAGTVLRPRRSYLRPASPPARRAWPLTRADGSAAQVLIFFLRFTDWVRATPKPLQPTRSERIRDQNCGSLAGPIQSRAGTVEYTPSWQLSEGGMPPNLKTLFTPLCAPKIWSKNYIFEHVIFFSQKFTPKGL